MEQKEGQRGDGDTEGKVVNVDTDLLCMATKAIEQWCITLSFRDCGQNESDTRRSSLCLLGQTLKTQHDHP